tara:strand:+ start:272 stop:529 length:258 start_codon:yes stop_codon:yes gene_type:complete
MVWINKTIILLSLLFFPLTHIYSNELNDDEQMYFNFLDFNNDNQVSLSEIEQSISIIFQIVDFNQDGYISKSEISELKNIIDSLR